MARRAHQGLDATDRKILRILAENGRISNVDLASQVNLSTTPCAERVRRLERDGVIKGYQANLDKDQIGLSTCIFIEVKLDHTTSAAFGRFKQAVLEMPEVLECYMIAGEFDYLIKLMVSDVNDLSLFMNKTLPRLKDVQQTRSYIVVEELKYCPSLPVPEP